MRAPLKLALFAVSLAVVFLVAFGVGAAVGPFGESPSPDHSRHPTTTTMEDR